MYALTGSGPSRRMRSRSLRRSGLSALDVSWGSIAGRRGALARGPHHVDAEGDHRQRVEDAGRERAEGQPVPGIGLAEQFAEGAGQSVSGEERAADEARPP